MMTEFKATSQGSALFSEFRLRELKFRNRVFVSPMCQYSSDDGVPGDWHMVHLGSRAVGGAGLVMVEASAVSPEGRISPRDSGMWNAKQAEAFRPIVKFISDNGAVAAIQLAHAGRKASSEIPWLGTGPVRDTKQSWQALAPSALAFSPEYPTPREMSSQDIKTLIENFKRAATLSLQAGFQVVEIHAAHGYLLHEFLSPLSNTRTDDYGGSIANRMRLTLEVAREVRKLWPEQLPVFVRLSVSDWSPGGWDLEGSIELSRELLAIGVDLIDCSSGGLVPHAKIPVGPDYQVPFAEAIRRTTRIASGAVGLITKAQQAEAIIARGQADVVFLARELLRDPYWPRHAARELGVEFKWPVQYERARMG